MKHKSLLHFGAVDDGILDNVFRIMSLEAELSEISIDGTIVRVHQHSAGAKKGAIKTRAEEAAED